MLTFEQLARMKHHLYLQAATALDDPEDNLDLTILSSFELDSSAEAFTKKISALTFDACSNLHQITLADALVFLSRRFPEETANLGRIADYYYHWLKD